LEAARFAKGTVVLLIGGIVSSALGFFEHVVSARVLGSFGYGLLNVGIVITSLLAMFASLGLRDALTREVAYLRGKGKEVDTVVCAAFFVSFFASVVLMLVVWVSAPVIGPVVGLDGYWWLIRLLVVSVPLLVVSDLFIAVARAYGRVAEKVLVRDVGFNALWLLGSLVSIALGIGIAGFALSYVFSASLVFIVLFYMLRRRALMPHCLRVGVKMAIVVSLLSFSLPLLVSSTLGALMTYSDTLMLGILRGAADAGLYGAAASPARFVPFVLSVAGYLVLPLFARLYAVGNLREFGRLYVVIAKWVFVLTFPIVVALVSSPRLVIGIIFGRSYLPASSCLVVLALGFLFHVMMGPNGIAIVAVRRSDLVMKISVVTITLNIFLNALLIPVFGILGAAVATSVSYIFSNILATFYLYRIIGVKLLEKQYLEVVAAAFSLMFISSLVGCTDLLCLFGLAVAGTVAVIIIALILVIPGEDEFLLRVAAGTPLERLISISMGLRRRLRGA